VVLECLNGNLGSLFGHAVLTAGEPEYVFRFMLIVIQNALQVVNNVFFETLVKILKAKSAKYTGGKTAAEWTEWTGWTAGTSVPTYLLLHEAGFCARTYAHYIGITG
jgi:hypothetical protein